MRGMESYIAINKDEKVRMASRSGGVFTAISDVILDNGGVVYGVKMSNEMEAVHTRATTKSERDAFRGSKYVRSDMVKAFEQVQADLKNGLTVLFTGTPCQIALIKTTVRKDNIEEGQLICVDIVCHGTPKKECFEKYKDYLEIRYQGSVESFDFRNKRYFGWKSHVETFVINGKQHIGREYTDLFYQHLLFPKGCFKCKFKSLKREGDISLADAWGNSKENMIIDNKGANLVLVNTKIGTELFNRCSHKLDYKPCNIEEYMQPPLKENFAVPQNYDEFWKDMKTMSWEQLYKHYATTPYWKRVLRKIRYIVK